MGCDNTVQVDATQNGGAGTMSSLGDDDWGFDEDWDETPMQDLDE